MKKKILYLAFAPIIDGNGVAQKIIAQCNALKGLGHEVVFCHFKSKSGQTVAYIDHKKFINLGGRVLTNIQIFVFFYKLSHYVKKQRFDAVYVRYEKNANLGFIKFLKSLNGICKCIMEIPTYPYDSEIQNPSIYRRLKLWEERYFREKFSNCIDYIATYTNDSTIFGVKSFRISNAVDEKTISLRERSVQDGSVISFIGVANIAFWHGYDRLLYGLRKYYDAGGKQRIIFRIVGEGNPREREYLKNIVRKEHLETSVEFYANKSGNELDDLFNISDFAIGCLGCHRKNITTVKSLKNVEYAMRGIPFIYSEVNDDFDGKPYVLKASADDSDININSIIQFLNKTNFCPAEIRKDVAHLTWERQMKVVCTYFNGTLKGNAQE